MRERLGLAALVSALVLATGCGGGDDGAPADPVSRVPTDGGLQEDVRAASTPPAEAFPAAEGRTLQEIAEEVKGGGTVEAGLASSVFVAGGEDERLAFGVIDQEGQFMYGPTAVYVAPTPADPAQGPFLAPADVLVTEGRYRSRQAATETDPFAAVYQTQVPFDKPGMWTVLTVTQSGGRYYAAPTQVQVQTEKQDRIPDVGEPAPEVQTDTLASARGNVEAIDTRVPPSDMHEASFAEVVGQKPVALLFATPQLCASRVCGPVTDIALQMKAEYGDRVEFIHQEVYEDNDPNQGLRDPLEAFRLPTEPWLFIVGRDGRITERLEGSFGVSAFEDAVETAL